nr:hypothetical protein CFP56_71095 [Quercus suber]
MPEASDYDVCYRLCCDFGLGHCDAARKSLGTTICLLYRIVSVTRMPTFVAISSRGQHSRAQYLWTTIAKIAKFGRSTYAYLVGRSTGVAGQFAYYVNEIRRIPD